MSDSNLTKLSINDINSSTFDILLRFIYCDPNLIIEEQDQIFQLLILSDKYLLPELKSECERVLIQMMSIETFVKIAKAAEGVDSLVIKEAVCKFAIENAKVLKESGEMQTLPKSLLIMIFESLTRK